MKKINFRAALNNSTGYSVCSVNIGQNLSRWADLSLFPIGSSCSTIKEWVNKNHYINNFPDKNAPTLQIWHEPHLYEHISRPLISWPIFEVNRFPSNIKHSLSWSDHLIVCTEWAKRVLVENKISTEEKVSVVPLGVNPNIFYDRVPPVRDKYVFINIGKWSVNKGHDVLCEIFNRAFSEKDDVELWMFPHNNTYMGDVNEKWIRPYKISPLGGKIKIFDVLPSQEDIAKVISDADCGIFPARCEGWNLPLLEVMSCNRPVICTNYSGHTGFCTDENAFLVESEGLESADDGKWFFGNAEWTSINIDEFVNKMRYCYENRPQNPLGVRTGENLTWRNSAKKTFDVIKGVVGDEQ